MVEKYGQQPAGRVAYLDDVRALAVIFVVGGHTASLAASLLETGSIRYRVLTLFYVAFSSCNMLFVLLSGALLLPVAGEGAGLFYRKRFLRVAVPLAVYYVLYVCAKEGAAWLCPDHWIPMLQRILAGEPPEAPHFWLVYVILFLYLLTPFFRWVVQNVPPAVLSGVVLAMFLADAAYVCLPPSGAKDALAPIVESYAGVFLLGYFLVGPLPRSVENAMLALGAASLLAACFLILGTDSYGAYLYGNTPLMALYASALFLAAKRAESSKRRESRGGLKSREGRESRGGLKSREGRESRGGQEFRQRLTSRLGRDGRRFVRLVSEYSFSILLIHWGVMHYVVKQILGVNVLGGGIVGGCLVMAALTFSISLLGAAFLDNTLFRAIYGVLRWAGGLFAKREGGKVP